MIERLLIVGLGSIGKRHARIVRELLPGVRIAALRRSAEGCVNEPNVDLCVSSMEEALEFLPQAAVIASPSSLHLGAAIPLAQAGVPLLVEKPISSSGTGVSELIEICRVRRVCLMTGYNMRFIPSLQKFRELIKERRVGRILSVRAEVGQYLPAWRPAMDYRQSASAQAGLGGGVLLELSHEIDYLRWLFGEVEWVNATLRKQSGLEIDVEDTAHLVLGFMPDAGEPAVVAELNMDFIRHDTTRYCTVIGERGTLRWNALSGMVEIFEQGAESWQTLFTHQRQRDDTYLAEWRNFLACIENGSDPMITGDDGLKVIQLIDAARISSSSGTVVRVADCETGLS